MQRFKPYTQLVSEAAQSKIDRSAFIYMQPKEPVSSFAQCSTCAQFLPTKRRCAIFTGNDKVVKTASCALYVHGIPHDDQQIINSTNPQEAGYINASVRCENCEHFDGRNTCQLFAKLNNQLPDMFDLDTNVNSKGCCNAWQK